MLERAIRDPGYNVLKKYLHEAHEYLEKDGFLLLGFSNVMGDMKFFESLAMEAHWKYREMGRMDEQGLICLIQL
jgi:hypothetical protein